MIQASVQIEKVPGFVPLKQGTQLGAEKLFAVKETISAWLAPAVLHRERIGLCTRKATDDLGC